MKNSTLISFMLFAPMLFFYNINAADFFSFEWKPQDEIATLPALGDWKRFDFPGKTNLGEIILGKNNTGRFPTLDDSDKRTLVYPLEKSRIEELVHNFYVKKEKDPHHAIGMNYPELKTLLKDAFANYKRADAPGMPSSLGHTGIKRLAERIVEVSAYDSPKTLKQLQEDTDPDTVWSSEKRASQLEEKLRKSPRDISGNY